jgi:hypothetical protein
MDRQQAAIGAITGTARRPSRKTNWLSRKARRISEASQGEQHEVKHRKAAQA